MASTKNIPVRVMLPLDTLEPESGNFNEKKYKDALPTQFKILSSMHVTGVSLDVWWGACEHKEHGDYNFSGVATVVRMARDANLNTSCIMSFHACGSGPGDSVNIPLPEWVCKPAETQGLFCQDVKNNVCTDYISPSCDFVVLNGIGENPLQLYQKFMSNFAMQMKQQKLFVEEGNQFGITEIHVGLGPCGELRYPSYEASKGWKYPGVGSFQCFDAEFKRLAKNARVVIPPSVVLGAPDLPPEKWPLFASKEQIESESNKKFFVFYNTVLVDHGEHVIVCAKEAFKKVNVILSAKIAGIHWLFDTVSRAAELTAGYKGYNTILDMFQRKGIHVIFTCFEKCRANEIKESPESRSNPEMLIEEFHRTCLDMGIHHFDAENAMNCLGDQEAFNRIINNSRINDISAFTFLRLTDSLVGKASHSAISNILAASSIFVGGTAVLLMNTNINNTAINQMKQMCSGKTVIGVAATGVVVVVCLVANRFRQSYKKQQQFKVFVNKMSNLEINNTPTL